MGNSRWARAGVLVVLGLALTAGDAAAATARYSSDEFFGYLQYDAAPGNATTSG